MTLVVGQQFTVTAHHLLPRLPTWHPCSRFHGHDYTVTIELHAPRASVTDDVSTDLRTAVADLEQQLHLSLLNDLGDELAERADHPALARWLHRVLAARMSPLGDHLAVQVEESGSRLPAVHFGAAVPADAALGYGAC